MCLWYYKPRHIFWNAFVSFRRFKGGSWLHVLNFTKRIEQLSNAKQTPKNITIITEKSKKTCNVILTSHGENSCPLLSGMRVQMSTDWSPKPSKQSAYSKLIEPSFLHYVEHRLFGRPNYQDGSALGRHLNLSLLIGTRLPKRSGSCMEMPSFFLRKKLWSQCHDWHHSLKKNLGTAWHCKPCRFDSGNFHSSNISPREAPSPDRALQLRSQPFMFHSDSGKSGKSLGKSSSGLDQKHPKAAHFKSQEHFAASSFWTSILLDLQEWGWSLRPTPGVSIICKLEWQASQQVIAICSYSKKNIITTFKLGIHQATQLYYVLRQCHHSKQLNHSDIVPLPRPSSESLQPRKRPVRRSPGKMTGACG